MCVARWGCKSCPYCDPAKDTPDEGEAQQASNGGYIGFWDGLLKSNPKPRGR